ncbi:MAG: Fe2+-dependent dioxygenase [Gammaproteobacteria bacterium]|nr:Fe2+-dependent dioxygenase [Gammaproteobacteria bacterium]
MLLRIKGLIPSDKLAIVRGILDSADFIDGKLSAGKEAVNVKSNEELPQNHPEMARLNNIVMGQLINHPVYKYGVLPHRIAAPFYARYTSGKQYGSHVDDPIMGTGDTYRTDVSITVFLNEPDEYEGGELTITSQYGKISKKLPAGDAILYPSGSLHNVAEVTSGSRLVAVTWAQSMIRDAGQRELLYNLSQARDELIKKDPDSTVTQKVSTSYINLVRMWAEV